MHGFSHEHKSCSLLRYKTKGIFLSALFSCCLKHGVPLNAMFPGSAGKHSLIFTFDKSCSEFRSSSKRVKRHVWMFCCFVSDSDLICRGHCRSKQINKKGKGVSSSEKYEFSSQNV